MKRLCITLLLAGWACAYNPPVDTAGPLTVRLSEPALGAYGAGGLAELNRPGVPLTLPVSLENSAETEVRGTLRIQVIDRWSVNPAAAPFTVAPRGRARLEFTLSFGEGTHNAAYPVHAYAEFDYQGRRLTAHPVLILNVRQPDPPRAKIDIPWEPVRIAAGRGLALWRLPVFRRSARVEEGYEPGLTGRETNLTSPTAQMALRVARGETREAISVGIGLRAPAMRERVARALVEFPLELPQAAPLKLRFAGAVSDGAQAVLRVRAVPFEAPPGEMGAVLSEQAGTPDWKETEADLARFAGRRIRLQLESDGGAWAGSGQAYWAEPTVVAGAAAAPPPFPPASDAGSRVLGKAGEFQVLLWPGRRGALDSTIAFRGGGRQAAFNGFRVRVLGDALDDWRSASELMDVREETAGGRYRVRQRFRTWAGAFDLVSELWIEQDVLRAGFKLENTPAPRPWVSVRLESVAAGPWSVRAERVYGGVGNVIQEPQAFQLGFDGHSLATSFVGFDFAGGISLVQASDVPPDRLEVDPDRRLYSLNVPHTQTMTFIPVSDVWAGVRAWRDISGMRASAGVPKLAGRFVFDLWGGRYGESAKGLSRAFRYGLTNAAVVWHNWQRWGYDYRLPDIYPPNPQWGTEEEFKALAELCRKNGVYFAPHDNYIDYYPDSDGFSYANIAFEPNGQPRRAWFNNGRQAQSYRARGDRIRLFLERNLAMLRDGLNPNSYFIDVWSSMGPYDYWTEDGRFVDRLTTRATWRESFAWIRDFLGGAPQISEAGHDQLIGWLDGAQANHLRVEATPGRSFIWNIRCAGAERIPWIDAAYHDLFILHGAGYGGRYSAGLGEAEHGIYSDDYMATEVLTGHPAMVSAPFSRDVVRKYWLLDGLMRALAMKRMEGFSFASGDLHRQQVSWGGGGTVSVNRGSGDWSAGGRTLPRYGFYARAGGVEAAIERLAGGVVEWARTPEIFYLNGRGKSVTLGAVSTDGAFRLSVEGGALQLTPLPDSPAFTARLSWSELPWKLPRPTQAEALDENGAVLGRLALKDQAGVVTLETRAGEFAYRLR